MWTNEKKVEVSNSCSRILHHDLPNLFISILQQSLYNSITTGTSGPLLIMSKQEDTYNPTSFTTNTRSILWEYSPVWIQSQLVMIACHTPELGHHKHQTLPANKVLMLHQNLSTLNIQGNVCAYSHDPIPPQNFLSTLTPTLNGCSYTTTPAKCNMNTIWAQTWVWKAAPQHTLAFGSSLLLLLGIF